MKNQFKNYFILIFISAICTGISMQPLSLGFVSWFSLIPLFHVLNKQKSYKNIFIFSFIWGIVYHFIVVFWLTFNIGMPEIFGSAKFLGAITMIAVVFILSTNIILIGLIWYRLKTKFPKYSLILFAIIWTSVEFIRSYGFLGFPWVSISNSQIDYFYLIQNVEITSIYGISFWIVAFNIAIYNSVFLNKNFKSMILLIVIAVSPWLTGLMLFNKSNDSINEGQPITITSIQPNISLEEKRSGIRTFDNGSKTFIRSILFEKFNRYSQDVDLVIFPESSLPFSPNSIAADKYILFGTTIFDVNNIKYNSSALYTANGLIDTYHKRQLVPMVEYIPLSEFFSNIRAFTKGNKNTVFTINDFSFIAPICFESTFPHISRSIINNAKNIDVIIYLVNDGWYTTAPQPQQHANQSIYRAIENRKPVIRCANTGISMYIDKNGKVIDQLKLNEEGVLENIKIYKNNNKTFYARYGNVFAFMLFIINIGLLIRSFFIKEKYE